MASSCCSSCWCAPFRWLTKCCCKKQEEQNIAITQVVVSSIQGANPKPSHHRERTWKLSNGKMTYDVERSEKK